MRFDLVNPLEYPYWNEQVLATNDYSFFHCAGWAEVLHRSYSYKPAYFTLWDGKELKALIPVMEVKSFLTGRRGVSLTFTDYCEPIVAEREQFDLLLERVVDHGRKQGWNHIEFRGGQKYLPAAPVFATYLGHTLALAGGEQQLLSLFRSSTRRNITKAALEGVETRIETSLSAVEEYYRLHCLTRKRHAVPPQPFHFFRNIHQCIIAKGQGFVTLASREGKTIAGAVYFHFGDQALYKYGASDETWQHLRANNLVMWEAIRWYGANGFKTFCFGRTDCDHTGLRQFKNGWGTKEKILHYYKYDVGMSHYVGNPVRQKGVASRLMESTPHGILRMVGRLLYRHMG